MRTGISVFLLFILLPFFVNGQIITTFSGTGVAGNTGDGGLATAANINFPISGVFDKYGNYYFTTSNIGCSVRKVSPDGLINTIAGGSCGFAGDSGLATLAKLNTPQGLAVDTFGNLYIADNSNNRIRKVDISTGIITTVAGNGTIGFSGDGGLAINSTLSDPLDLCFDKLGNLYIADGDNFRIRKIDPSGIISTFAGNGTVGSTGEGGPAINASMTPSALGSDKFGNIYIADNNIGETRVLKVDTFGIISRVAGNPAHYIYNGDDIPATDAYISPVKIVVDNYGNFFIADMVNCRIREIDHYGIIHTVAGNGTAGYGGDANAAISAQLNYPAGIALDSCGNLYIADSRNYRIRKVTYPKCNYLAEGNIQPPQNISIYPNPATSELNIDGLTEETNYRILNITGIVEQRGILKKGNNSIPLQTFPTGIYLLELTDDKGTRTIHKIVKL